MAAVAKFRTFECPYCGAWSAMPLPGHHNCMHYGALLDMNALWQKKAPACPICNGRMLYMPPGGNEMWRCETGVASLGCGAYVWRPANEKDKE